MIRVNPETGVPAMRKAMGSRIAQKPIRPAPTVKKSKPRVTKSRNIVTPPAPVPSAGRPKVHATAADRQKAYRERQKVKA